MDANEKHVLKKLVVIVPAYNEEERIHQAITCLLSIQQRFIVAGYEMLIYVVDDGSTDDTRRLSHEAGAHRVLRHRVNMGLGAAVRTGLTAARNDSADIAVKFDADLQHDPEDIFALIQPIIDDEAEVVYGNRFERIEYQMPLVRRIGNIVFTALMRWLTKWPLRDSQPGILAVSRTYLKVFFLPGDYNYTQQILLDAYHKAMRFAHVPVSFRKRVTGKSFVSFRYPFKVLPQIIIVLVAVKPMRIFGSIGLLFLGMGVIIFLVEVLAWFMGALPKPVQHVNAVLGLSFFGVQTLFFGLLAEVIVRSRKG